MPFGRTQGWKALQNDTPNCVTLIEPPDADPHVRWCERGRLITAPYSIPERLIHPFRYRRAVFFSAGSDVKVISASRPIWRMAFTKRSAMVVTPNLACQKASDRVSHQSFPPALASGLVDHCHLLILSFWKALCPNVVFGHTCHHLP